MKRHAKPKPSLKPGEYKLSIVLPQAIIDAIDRVAEAQFRTRASLVRQALAERFLRKVA